MPEPPKRPTRAAKVEANKKLVEQAQGTGGAGATKPRGRAAKAAQPVKAKQGQPQQGAVPAQRAQQNNAVKPAALAPKQLVPAPVAAPRRAPAMPAAGDAAAAPADDGPDSHPPPAKVRSTASVAEGYGAPCPGLSNRVSAASAGPGGGLALVRPREEAGQGRVRPGVARAQAARAQDNWQICQREQGGPRRARGLAGARSNRHCLRVSDGIPPTICMHGFNACSRPSRPAPPSRLP